jgi:type I restriction enzyme S subunit
MTFNGPIGGLIDFAIGGGWGTDVPKENHSRIAIIRGTDIPKVASGDFSTVPYRYESEKKISNRILAAGDVVLETAGGSSANGQYTGRTLLITQEILDILGPTICASFCKKLVLKKELVSPWYFYFYMQDLYKSGRIASYDSQSTGISNFQYEAFVNNEHVALPELELQTTVGQILSNLQRKINGNSLISKTLEGIAQTIFKSWFIDFDPVKAKMAGETPAGMDAVTSALFPDAMKESELGLIPQGWQLGILDDIIEIHDSKRIPIAGAERKKRPGKYPYYGATGALDFIDSFIFEGPHILVGEDGTVITDLGTPLVQYVWNKFWVSNHAHVLQAKNGFSVEQLKLLIERIQISNYITGAVQPKLNQGNLKSIPCIIPPATVSAAFGSIIEPIFRNIRRLTDENKVLAELRDSLMPRLISGEQQIPEEMLTT